MFLIKSFWHFVDEILEKPFIYDLFIINKKKKMGTFSKTNIRTADCYCCYYISSSCEINARINATLAKCYQINRKIYGITDSMIRRAHAASITSFIDGFFAFITNHLYLLSALCRFDTKMKVILITPRSILFFFFFFMFSFFSFFFIFTFPDGSDGRDGY